MFIRHSRLGRLPEVSGAILLLVTALTIWAAWERETQNKWVEHTLEVQKAISEIETSVIDAQSANRGYIITGEESYLAPYTAALQSLPGQIDQLEKLITDNPEQISALQKLKATTNQRLERLAQGIELRRTQGLQAAVTYVQTHNGALLMQQIRAGIAEMQAREAGFLTARRNAAATGDRYVTLLSGLGMIVATAICAIWIGSARRTTQELQQTISEREAAEAQVRQMQKMEAVGQLTGGIAHDFNNMLAVIISALGLMKKRLTAGDTDVGKFVEAAMDGANRAATLTKRLTAFSRQSALSPQPTNCNKFVAGMSELIERTLGGGVKIETVLGAGLWLTNVDASQLENALLNLAVNARDAMPEGGRITIETSNTFLDERYARAHAVPSGQYVMIALTDNGTGMPADVAARAFDPFFTTKAVGKGTGLGLSQVHGFVRQSGGHVKIYSEPGEGTSVKIYLPRFYGSEEKSAPAEAPAKSLAAAEPSRFTILVVEDDDGVRKATTALVRELGFNVLQAADAREALVILDQKPGIDLLFTDIVMPGTNGRKLADEAVRRRPDLKVLFTTGFTRNAIVHHGVLDAGLEYIAKPFTISELASKLAPIILSIKPETAEQS